MLKDVVLPRQVGFGGLQALLEALDLVVSLLELFFQGLDLGIAGSGSALSRGGEHGGFALKFVYESLELISLDVLIKDCLNEKYPVDGANRGVSLD